MLLFDQRRLQAGLLHDPLCHRQLAEPPLLGEHRVHLGLADVAALHQDIPQLLVVVRDLLDL